MRNLFTLTRTLVLGLLVITFTTASAAFGDDSVNCKKSKCCKAAKAKKANATLVELDKALAELQAQLKQLNSVAIEKEVRQAIRTIKLQYASAEASPMICLTLTTTGDETPGKAEDIQKINNKALDQEMDKTQEQLSQMDEALKQDNAKAKRAAEQKTGIKS